LSAKRDQTPTELIDWHYFFFHAQPAKNLSPFSTTILGHLEFYINGLIVQWNRIQSDEAESSRRRSAYPRTLEEAEAYVQERSKMGTAKRLEEAKLDFQLKERFILDVHFYLVCWDKVNKYFGRFANKEKDNPCIWEAWKGISSLTEKASRARDYFEHFDKMLPKDYAGDIPLTQSFSISASQFEFGYSELSGKRKKFERRVTLGRLEIETVMVAFEQSLSCLGRSIKSDYFQSAVHVQKVDSPKNSGHVPRT